MEYKVTLQAFEGPLDLLLHLIEKAEVDIYDIPISNITDQYINYLNKMEEMDLNITSEFLVMAAKLLEIKSKMLLPSEPKDDTQSDEELIDPREEIVRKLIEYKKYKSAANELKSKLEIQNKVFFKPREEIELFIDKDISKLEGLIIDDLFEAFNSILIKHIKRKSKLQFNEIQREELTIEDSMDQIMQTLKYKEKLFFEDMFNSTMSKSKMIVIFLSVLELIKLKQIKVIQEINFGKIVIIINKDIKGGING